MSEHVEFLKSLSYYNHGAVVELIFAAAAELERLEIENGRLEASLTTDQKSWLEQVVTIDRLHGELESRPAVPAEVVALVEKWRKMDSECDRGTSMLTLNFPGVYAEELAAAIAKHGEGES